MGQGGGVPAFHGMQRIATVEELDRWVSHARANERFVYCEAPMLIRGPTADRARNLEQEGLVTLFQSRRAGGGFEFVAQRAARKARVPGANGGSKPAMSAAVPERQSRIWAETEAVFRLLSRAANFERVCPTQGEIARALEAEGMVITADQARQRIMRLIDSGAIRSTLCVEDGVPVRVVTIVKTGKRTALPPTWAAMEREAAR